MKSRFSRILFGLAHFEPFGVNTEMQSMRSPSVPQFTTSWAYALQGGFVT